MYSFFFGISGIITGDTFDAAFIVFDFSSVTSISLKMLEDPSFALSRYLRSACEQEANWVNCSFGVNEAPNFKRKFEDGEKLELKKSSKSSKLREGEETLVGFCYLSLYQVHQSDNGDDAGDQSYTSSLIHQIGWDNSVNCIARCSRSDYGSIAQLNRSFRDLIQSKELYKLRQRLGIVESWVYFSCSLLEWEAFDPIRLCWMHLPRMPSNDCFMFSDKESLAVGTELLVFGKEILSHVIYKYSILTNSWSSGVTMNIPRCLFASASLGEIAVVAGGCDSGGNILSSVELYNSGTGTWVTLPSMNKPRKKCSGVFMDGKFYVMGGIGIGNPNLLTCGEVFDLETRTWNEIPDMFPLGNVGDGVNDAHATAEAPPLLAVVNNELYAADYAGKEVSKYNKQSNSWARVGSLPERAVSTNGWGLAFRACGDKLIVIGGPRDSDGGVEVNSWAPSEDLQQWTLLARKQSGGFVYNCAVMGC